MVLIRSPSEHNYSDWKLCCRDSLSVRWVLFRKVVLANNFCDLFYPSFTKLKARVNTWCLQRSTSSTLLEIYSNLNHRNNFRRKKVKICSPRVSPWLYCQIPEKANLITAWNKRVILISFVLESVGFAHLKQSAAYPFAFACFHPE